MGGDSSSPADTADSTLFNFGYDTGSGIAAGASTVDISGIASDAGASAIQGAAGALSQYLPWLVIGAAVLVFASAR